MQGQQQEHQPHPSAWAPQKKRGEEKSFPRTHQTRFSPLVFFKPGLFLPPKPQPREGAPEGKVWEGDTPPDQVGCDSQRNGAGEPIGPRGCWHKLAGRRLGQSAAPRGGSPPTRNRAQWGKGLRLPKRKTNLHSLAASGSQRWSGLGRFPPEGRRGPSPSWLPSRPTLWAPPPPSSPASGFRNLPSETRGKIAVPHWVSPGSRRFC